MMQRMVRRLREWSLLSASPLAVALWGLLFAFSVSGGVARAGIPAIGGGADTTSSTLSSDFVTYIADKTLMVAEKNTRLMGLADKAQLPQRNGKTFQYTRYDRLALPQSTLTEGVTPASTQMSISTVTATVEQWGQVVVLTDLADLVPKHSTVQKALNLLGLAAAETVDRELQEVLLAGTNVQYANARSSRATLVAGDVLTTGEIRKTVANLRNNGAMAFEGDDTLVGVIDPSVEADMTSDTTFVAASQYSKIANLLNGEIGRWMSVRWVRSNFVYTFTGVASATAADVATGGSINANTAVYTVVTAVNTNTGFEEKVYQEATTTTANDGSNTHIIRITAPSTTGYTYNVYAGTVSGTTYQVTTGVAASATYNITSVPSSGTTNPAIPGTGLVAHIVWIFGKEAFTAVELSGMSLQTYVTPKQASDSDPLEQRRKIGWKLAFKGVICNNNFFRRIECLSNY